MTKTREYKKLNSTGSLLRHVPTNTIYSYNTPIYREFTLSNGKVLKVFNKTYYSATTRRHQASIREYELCADIVFHYCPYGEWSLNTAFEHEITITRQEINRFNAIPHKLGSRQAAKLKELNKELITRLKVLQNLYKEI